MYKKVEDPWAYLAGFIEGDGCLGLHKGTRGLSTALIVVQKEREILDYFQSLTGVGNVSKRQLSRVSGYGGTGTSYDWRVRSGRDLKEVLPKVIPYLFSSKKRKARLVLRYCKTSRTQSMGSKKLSLDVRKRRRRIIRQWSRVLSFEIKRVAHPSYSLLAGFVDSDGSVGQFKNQGGYLYWRIVICQKERALLDYLRDEAGGLGSIYQRKNNTYAWHINNQWFVKILNQYLKIKRKKI